MHLYGACTSMAYPKGCMLEQTLTRRVTLRLDNARTIQKSFYEVYNKHDLPHVLQVNHL